ncbi:hypothetical protein IQ238_13810 [Pleurocapsales cyanobacterium LEGE 06147]|nr:hypothetical protein [Pleurocapsales cyanobacterium LEGE 06147]
MLTIPTVEVRWFEEGTIPAVVKNWFYQDCPGEPLGFPEQRKDLYLYLPNCEVVSFKLRQEKLELKWRKAEFGTRQFGKAKVNYWEGKLEQWFKCSYEDLTPLKIDYDYAEGLAAKSWIEVKKIRWQRSYQDVACELTQLTVSDRIWWTIGLEMEQNKTNNSDYFENIVSEIGITYRGPQLAADKSYGYPAWCKDRVK